MKMYNVFKLATIFSLCLSIGLNVFVLNFSPTTLIHLCALAIILVDVTNSTFNEYVDDIKEEQ